MRVVAIVRRVGVGGGRWGFESGLRGGGEGVDRSERRTVFPLTTIHELASSYHSDSLIARCLTCRDGSAPRVVAELGGRHS